VNSLSYYSQMMAQQVNFLQNFLFETIRISEFLKRILTTGCEDLILYNCIHLRPWKTYSDYFIQETQPISLPLSILHREVIVNHDVASQMHYDVTLKVFESIFSH
jgi:hypothetical protein